MAGMFPTMVSDPHDPNRRVDKPVQDGWPRSLRASYWLVVAAAVLLLVTGVMLLLTGFPAGADEAFRDVFMRNMRIVAWGNIVLACGLGAAAAYFERGSAVARRWAAACTAGAIFLNVASFMLRVSSWASFVIVVVLGIALWLMFTRSANVFVDRANSQWEGVA